MSVVVIGNELDLREKTLEQLAEIANQKHLAMGDALTRAVDCAIAVGEALNEARDRFSGVPEWAEWLAENFHTGYDGANGYMRLAHYKDHLPASQWTQLLRNARQKQLENQRKRRRRAREAELALQEKQKRVSMMGRMKAEGGAVEETWTSIRSALYSAQRAYDQAAGDRDKRRAISNTMNALWAAEKEICKAPEVPS